MPLNPTLPVTARQPINRCNLPAVILGSLTFQRHPTALFIDGVRELHSDLFRRLDREAEREARATLFKDYMVVHFRLEHPEDAGLTPGQRVNRGKADYLRLIRGWAFDPDSREGAVLKGWVESRFGLVPRYHRGPIRTPGDPTFFAYQELRTTGLYNTNALEAQLDLLYTYAQYELEHAVADRDHLPLYRGINRLGEHELLGQEGAEQIVLLNNLNSFTDNRQRADEFGDQILETRVPRSKVFFYNRLLPGLLKGEDEYAVIGGVYGVRLAVI